jgi:hypothetical protein
MTNLPDLDFDGKSDILLQNNSGQVLQWGMDGSRVVEDDPLGNPGAAWSVVAAGEASLGLAAGSPFVLMQNNSTDEVWGWAWDPITHTTMGSAPIGNPGPGWHVTGAADIYGDGVPATLMQSDSGQVWAWAMDTSHLVSTQTLGVAASTSIGNPGPSWHMVGTGDFNGDGKDDLLFQNDSGQIWQWQMNGSQVAASSQVGNPGPAWHVVGTGDFDGDGKSDIILQNDSGQVLQWLMDGCRVVEDGPLGNPGPAWHVVGTGDFNGDGKSDLLFQNDSGQIWQWLMNGNQVAASSSVANPGPAWHVV